VPAGLIWEAGVGQDEDPIWARMGQSLVLLWVCFTR